MEIFSSKHDEKEKFFEPVRGSIAILIVKLLMILVLFDGIYSLIFYLLTLGISLPFDLHHHISELLFGLQLIKNILQMVLLLYVVLGWANNLYFFTDRHIVKRTGTLHVNEEMYHYDNIRSITINQSWLGKLFHYGDIILKTSASGGYQDDIVLTEIENPQKYQSMLRKLF